MTKGKFDLVCVGRVLILLEAGAGLEITGTIVVTLRLALPPTNRYVAHKSTTMYLLRSIAIWLYRHRSTDTGDRQRSVQQLIEDILKLTYRRTKVARAAAIDNGVVSSWIFLGESGFIFLETALTRIIETGLR